MRKIHLDISKYQRISLDEEFTLKPFDIFRAEGVPLDVDLVGNILLMFTGVISKKSVITYLHCVPLYFYGKDGPKLKVLYQGQCLWVEITEDKNPGPIPAMPTGYWN